MEGVCVYVSIFVLWSSIKSMHISQNNSINALIQQSCWRPATKRRELDEADMMVTRQAKSGPCTIC